MPPRKYTPEEAKRRKAAAEKKRRAARKALRPRVSPDGSHRRAEFVPTKEQREQVRAMVGYGLTHEEVACLTINPATGEGIALHTLHKHFKRELADGHAMAKALVLQSLFKKARDEKHPQAAVCAMFIAKCRYGWRQADRVVHSFEGGMQGGVLVVPASETPEEWVERQKQKNAKKKPPGEVEG